MPKKHRIAIYSYLFKGESHRCKPCCPAHPAACHDPAAVCSPHSLSHLTFYPHRKHQTPSTLLACSAEGVLSCQKDVKKPTHHEMDLPNLHVVKAMLSLKSRGYVREVFNWCVCRACCSLNPQGISI